MYRTVYEYLHSAGVWDLDSFRININVSAGLGCIALHSARNESDDMLSLEYIRVALEYAQDDLSSSSSPAGIVITLVDRTAEHFQQRPSLFDVDRMRARPCPILRHYWDESFTAEMIPEPLGFLLKVELNMASVIMATLQSLRKERNPNHLTPPKECPVFCHTIHHPILFSIFGESKQLTATAAITCLLQCGWCPKQEFPVEIRMTQWTELLIHLAYSEADLAILGAIDIPDTMVLLPTSGLAAIRTLEWVLLHDTTPPLKLPHLEIVVSWLRRETSNTANVWDWLRRPDGWEQFREAATNVVRDLKNQGWSPKKLVSWLAEDCPFNPFDAAEVTSNMFNSGD
jgi:hypothetical protein